MTTKTKPTKPMGTPQVPSSSLRCRDCGAVLINTATGSVCPDNMQHGKIMPHVDQRDLDRERVKDWSNGLPEAIQYLSTSCGSGKKVRRYRIGRIGGLIRLRPLRRIPINTNDYLFATFCGATYCFLDPSNDPDCEPQGDSPGSGHTDTPDATAASSERLTEKPVTGKAR